MKEWKLIEVEPQPMCIASSGRWVWDIPEFARSPGCSTSVCTASREWWEYLPSAAKPHAYAEAVLMRDERWYWAVPIANTAISRDGGKETT